MDGAIPGTASAELLLFEVVAVDQLHVEDSACGLGTKRCLQRLEVGHTASILHNDFAINGCRPARITSQRSRKLRPAEHQEVAPVEGGPRPGQRAKWREGSKSLTSGVAFGPPVGGARNNLPFRLQPK